MKQKLARDVLDDGDPSCTSRDPVTGEQFLAAGYRTTFDNPMDK